MTWVGLVLATSAFFAALYVILTPSLALTPLREALLAFLVALVPAVLFAAEATARFDLELRGFLFSATGGAAIMLGAFALLHQSVEEGPALTADPGEAGEVATEDHGDRARSRRLTIAPADGRLAVTERDTVIGHVPPPYSGFADEVLPLDLALRAGLHYARHGENEARACQYLTLPERRHSDGGLDDGLRDEAARSLFRIVDTCYDEGLGRDVLRAQRHRERLYRHKERGDILYRYAQKQGDDGERDALYALAAASYLRALAEGRPADRAEAGDNIRDTLGMVGDAISDEDVREQIVGDIRSALDGRLSDPDLRGLPADIERAVGNPLEPEGARA